MNDMADMQQQTGRIGRVLVVYGDAATRRQCRRALEEAGCMVSEADTGVTALGAVREAVPALIVIDDQLPDVPGWQAAAWLRSMPMLQETPIVMLGVRPANADGPADPASWLAKPFSAGSLWRAIRMAWARSPRAACRRDVRCESRWSGNAEQPSDIQGR
jgi:DNA-binding response OmpR family regulator